MSRLLAYTSPARGHLYPVVPILCELGGRGHQTVLYGLSGELERPQSSRHQRRTRSIPASRTTRSSIGKSAFPRAQPLRCLETFAQRAQLEAPDLERAITAHRPDALLIDINCWGAGAVAQASGLPWALYSPYLLPLRSREVPPFGLGLRPRDGPLGRVRDALAARTVDLVFAEPLCPRSDRYARALACARFTASTSCCARLPCCSG